MDCAPLNMAHYHERRADRFLIKHRYDDASKAMKASLDYLQKAYANVQISKSIEVLDTQKWVFEWKLRQIEMQKLQHERLKFKEIVPLSEASSVVTLRSSDNSVATTAQSVAKSIDKTIKDFDAKFGSLQLSKENEDPSAKPMTRSEQSDHKEKSRACNISDLNDDMNSLALEPLELPSFDYNVFAHSLPSTNIAGMAESFQK